MRVGSKWGGQTGLRCFRTAAEENICSFNVTWRGEKKTVARGVSSVLLQPHRDEMLQQADSRPSQNNSRKCQTSVSEMRPGEVSSTFCDPPPLLPNYPPTSTSSQTGWLQGNRKRQKRAHCYVYTWMAALFAVMNRPPEKDIVQTHWQPQNRLWLMQGFTGTRTAQTRAHLPGDDSHGNWDKKLCWR